ncbi:MAG TPA: ATP-binding protein [Armatimonadota bacterium]|jgi:hypothetical protein
MPENERAIGRVVATEKKPNTAYSFHFWTHSQDVQVGIGTLVRVGPKPTEGAEGGEGLRARTVYGVVVEGYGYNDLDTPLSDGLGRDWEPMAEAITRRPEMRLYMAAVLRMEPEEPLQPVPIGAVYLADDEDVSAGLRMDAYQDRSGIPAGLYQNGKDYSPVYLDAQFLLGPESAHLNITGISGLATKTSAVEFLLSSIFQTHRESVAAVVFNVKGPDMLYLDLPAEPGPDHPYASLYAEKGISGLEPRDRELYQKLGLKAQPFDKVLYYAPFRADGVTLNSLRNHPELVDSVQPLCWGLKEVMAYADVVLNRDDLDAKADALVQYIDQRVIDQQVTVDGMPHLVRNFQDLSNWFDAVIAEMENTNQSQYQTHHYQTIRKVYNRLSNLGTRYKGLITNSEVVKDLPYGQFQDRTVYCVDISQLDASAQDLVFTRVVNKLREKMEENKLGVKQVVVFVDELNKYAPGDGADTYLKRTLLDISERGRYLGLVLFSAQQFRSQVHKRVVGNSATSLYGRMDMDELATPGYSTLTAATKEKLSTLSKGQLMLRHPHFSQPIFVKFPRPNVLRGSDGCVLFPPSQEPTLEDSAYVRLRRLDPSITKSQVRDAVSGVTEDEVARVINRLEQKGVSGDAMAAFHREVRQRAGLVEAGNGHGSPLEGITQDPNDADDPFVKF